MLPFGPLRLLALLLLFAWIHAVYPQDPGNFWCAPYPLPNETTFNVSQPVWYQEYYMYNYTANMTMVFKVYPITYGNEMLVALYSYADACPQPGWTAGAPLFQKEATNMNGPVSLTIPFVANPEVLLVRYGGGNYIITGCPQGECIDLCPNDCSGKGYCNITSGDCSCNYGYGGDDCSIWTCPGCKKKVPLGSWKVFYSVVVGVPTIVILSAGTILAYLFISRRNDQFSGRYVKLNGNDDGSSLHSMEPEDQYKDLQSPINEPTHGPSTPPSRPAN